MTAVNPFGDSVAHDTASPGQRNSRRRTKPQTRYRALGSIAGRRVRVRLGDNARPGQIIIANHGGRISDVDVRTLESCLERLKEADFAENPLNPATVHAFERELPFRALYTPPTDEDWRDLDN